MCEYSGRLIAWLDQELPDEEATNVEWHVGHCAECRKAVSAYEEVSGAFLACYEAAMAPRPRRKTLVWTAGGVAAAAAIVAVILLAQPRVEKLSIHLPSAAARAGDGVRKTVRRSRPLPHVRAAMRQRRRRPFIRSGSPRSQWWKWLCRPTRCFRPARFRQAFSFIADVRLSAVIHTKEQVDLCNVH